MHDIDAALECAADSRPLGEHERLEIPLGKSFCRRTLPLSRLRAAMAETQSIAGLSRAQTQSLVAHALQALNCCDPPERLIFNQTLSNKFNWQGQRHHVEASFERDSERIMTLLIRDLHTGKVVFGSPYGPVRKPPTVSPAKRSPQNDLAQQNLKKIASVPKEETFTWPRSLPRSTQPNAQTVSGVIPAAAARTDAPTRDLNQVACPWTSTSEQDAFNMARRRLISATGAASVTWNVAVEAAMGFLNTTSGTSRRRTDVTHIVWEAFHDALIVQGLTRDLEGAGGGSARQSTDDAQNFCSTQMAILRFEGALIAKQTSSDMIAATGQGEDEFRALEAGSPVKKRAWRHMRKAMRAGQRSIDVLDAAVKRTSGASTSPAKNALEYAEEQVYRSGMSLADAGLVKTENGTAILERFDSAWSERVKEWKSRGTGVTEVYMRARGHLASVRKDLFPWSD
jgi:hypothetical protein